ncbi:MAG: acetylglutamate kinase [Planctomycetota bacterium]
MANGFSVIKLGGAMTTDRGVLDAIASACDAGMVIVHGGGGLISQRLAERGLDIPKIDGIRPTHAEQLPVVVGVLAGEVNTQLVADLVSRGVNAVGLTLADGPLVTIEPSDPALGFVGTVSGGDAKAVRALVDAGFLPVVGSIGVDAQGQLRNVNADDAAAGLAAALNAESLTFVSDTAGVLDADRNTIASIAVDEVERLITDGIATDGMAAKLRAAATAASNHGIPVTIGGINADPAQTTTIHARALAKDATT